MPSPAHPDVLPGELRLLCVSDREPSWTVLALHLNDWGCREPRFRWCQHVTQVVTILREEPFDCVVVSGGGFQNSDQQLMEVLHGVGADGSRVPLLLCCEHARDELSLLISRHPCELLVTETPWQSPTLPAWINRTIRRFELESEHQKISTADIRRSVRERDETESLLEQQRQILRHATSDETESVSNDLPAELNGYYQELLRTYIMMGSGNLEDEIRQLAELLALSGIGPRSALRLHLERVESMVRGLGSRSSRHVMSRSDVLAMELIIELGECFRRKSALRGLGDFGVDLLHARTIRNKEEAVGGDGSSRHARSGPT